MPVAAVPVAPPTSHTAAAGGVALATDLAVRRELYRQVRRALDVIREEVDPSGRLPDPSVAPGDQLGGSVQTANGIMVSFIDGRPVCFVLPWGELALPKAYQSIAMPPGAADRIESRLRLNELDAPMGILRYEVRAIPGESGAVPPVVQRERAQVFVDAVLRSEWDALGRWYDTEILGIAAGAGGVTEATTPRLVDARIQFQRLHELDARNRGVLDGIAGYESRRVEANDRAPYPGILMHVRVRTERFVAAASTLVEEIFGDRGLVTAISDEGQSFWLGREPEDGNADRAVPCWQRRISAEPESREPYADRGMVL